MNKRGIRVAVAGAIVLVSTALLFAGKTATPPADETLWPTQGWATASPASVGLGEQVLRKLDKDMASGTYSQMVDSFAVFRCGKEVFENSYPHDYAKIYSKEAGERGPLNKRLTGRNNYFDSYWHPYYHGTDLHTMQSSSKTVTSVIIGAAMQRGDFKAALDTPVAGEPLFCLGVTMRDIALNLDTVPISPETRQSRHKQDFATDTAFSLGTISLATCRMRP